MSVLRLIQFRAGYNLPVHVAIEMSRFARHGLDVEFEYTPGSNYLIEALKDGKFEIAHTAADDLVADVEAESGHSDLFLFMVTRCGRHLDSPAWERPNLREHWLRTLELPAWRR